MDATVLTYVHFFIISGQTGDWSLSENIGKILENLPLPLCNLSSHALEMRKWEHAVSPYKQRLYKKRLVKFQQIKKRRLVNSSHAKKQISQNFCKKMAIF